MIMIGSKSRSICVKFREDDPDQIAAWEYLQNERGSKTYSEMIAALVKERTGDATPFPEVNREQADGLLTEIRHICVEIKDMVSGCALSPARADMGTEEAKPEKMAHKDEIPQGITDLMRQLSGEDEDE